VVKEAFLQIIDPGTSKVVIEHCFITLGKQKNKRSTIEIKDLTQENLENVIMKFFNDFEKISALPKA